MATHIDSTQTQKVTVSTPDGDKECWVVLTLVPVEDVAQHLADYDDTNTNHPLAVQAKPIARAILDEIKSKVEGA